MEDPAPLTDEDLHRCVAALRQGVELGLDDPRLAALEHAVTAFYRTQKKRRKRQRRHARAAHDAELLRGAYPAAPATPPEIVGTLVGEKPCYVCRARYREVSGAYPRLCPACAHDHSVRRALRVDLTGRRALVTGARVKLGYALALRLLRDGAHVTALTRFPRDAVRRYASEPDAGRWIDRLNVAGLDLRDLRAVVQWADAFRSSQAPVDILVQCAAQTVRRPDAHFAELRAGELRALPPPLEARCDATTPTTADDVSMKPTAGVDGLPPDTRPVHTWRETLTELDPGEMVECMAVNALAPSLMAARLAPWMATAAPSDRYIVHVTAAEGQFAQATRLRYHPHTNMAKAALNMLTHTSARDLARRGVFLVSVDPGWFSDEAPARARRSVARGEGFVLPVSLEDAAARVYDPIARGVLGAPVWGCLLRNYEPARW
jgi:NAD(P)-dependent dehydrogenase (short-subunit alcohol dehydrogenase family)